MIQRPEIDEKAKEFEIHPSNVERDYVSGWILFGLFTQSNLKESIFLKGGNALRKGYFENTRYSKDLDLGIPGDIDQNVLLKEINDVCAFIQDRAKITFDTGNTKVEEKFTNTEVPLPNLKVYEIRIYFDDWYGKRSSTTIKVSLDLTRFDKVIEPIQLLPLIHPYSDAKEVECNIRCMKLEEIIATKLKCLLQRQHAPDLFDYAYSIKILGGSLNKEEVAKLLIQKTIFSRNPHVLKEILKSISLSYFREYWDKTIVCAKQVMVSCEDAINILSVDLDDLFKIYPDNSLRNFAYFEAKYRNPIMQAGRSLTLLKIRYKYTDRLVEPYALKYQQKRDGTEREYLYVYNLSGGEHEPGMRSFIAENVQSIENTEEKFIPRAGYPVELSKAGELPENPYLFDPNKPLKQPRRRLSLGLNVKRSSTFYGLKYIFKCVSCGKKFTRSSYNGTLNPHKGKSGYPCYGGYGVYVGTKSYY